MGEPGEGQSMKYNRDKQMGDSWLRNGTYVKDLGTGVGCKLNLSQNVMWLQNKETLGCLYSISQIGGRNRSTLLMQIIKSKTLTKRIKNIN